MTAITMPRGCSSRLPRKPNVRDDSTICDPSYKIVSNPTPIVRLTTSASVVSFSPKSGSRPE